MKPQSRHFYWLDWVRFLSAMLVLAFHTRGSNWLAWGQLEAHSRTPLNWLFFTITRPGWEAVMVFFVLSGFLVGGRLLERVLQGRFDAQDYLIDRVARIYVPFLPALVFTAVATLVRGEYFSWKELLGNVFGLQEILCGAFSGNANLWSLSYEIWFYCLAGFVGVLLTTRGRARLWSIWGTALCLIVFLKLAALFLFSWCLGALGYFLMGQRVGRRWGMAGLLLTLLGVALSMFDAKSASINNQIYESFLPNREQAVLIMSVGLAVFLPFIARAAPATPFLNKVERLGGRLAAFSYTLYLIHHPLIRLWEYFLPGRYAEVSWIAILMYLLKLATMLLVSWVFYLPFEAKTGQVRRWLQAKYTKP